MVAKKAIGGIVKNTRPYSHQEVADFLAALAKKVDAGDVSLSDIERKRLMHLMHLFVVDSPYPSKVGIAHLLQAMQIPVNIYCRRRENRIDLVSLWKRVRYTTQYPVALM